MGFNTANFSIYRFVFFAFFACFSVHLEAADSQTVPRPKTQNECAAKATLTEQLTARADSVENSRDRLLSFLSGTQITDIPPTALFTVNLDDESAIDRRVVQLRTFVSQPEQGLSEKSRFLFTCADDYPELISERSRLLEVEAAVNVLRLQFLSLPAERRQSLLKAQEAARVHQTEIQRLEKERSIAEQQAAAAEKSIEIAQEQAKTANNSDLRELAAQRALIEKSRQELAQFKTRLVDSLEARTRGYRDQAQTLTLITAEINQTANKESIAASYEKVILIWRELADDVYNKLTIRAEEETLPNLPTAPASLLQRMAGSEDARAVQTAFAEVQAMHRDIEIKRQLRYQEERENYYRLLLQAGSLRAQLLEANLSFGNKAIIQLSDDYVKDLGRELRVVPLRAIAFLYTKFVDIRKKLATGLSGWIDVTKQLVLFILLLIIPFVAYRLLQRVTAWLDIVRYKLIQTHARQALLGETKFTAIALLLKRSVLYLPWIMMLVVLWVADILLENTDLAAIAKLIPYVDYYVVYRLFDSILFSLLSIVTFSRQIESLAGQKVRLHRTTRRIGSFFLISVIIAHITADVVGQTLFYRIVADVMLYVGIVIVSHAIREWRVEVGAAARAILPEKVAHRIQRWCESNASWIVCIPTLLAILGVIFWRWLYVWLGQFDFAKRVLAELFRRRVESSVGKPSESKPRTTPEETLPQDYLDRFALDIPKSEELFVIPSSGIVDEITELLRHWIKWGGDNTLALVGTKGSGKSTLLEILVSRTNSDADITRISVPARLQSEAEIEQCLSTIVTDSIGMISNGDKTRKKVVLLDNAHNLFIAKPGGFAAYRKLIEIVVSTSKTHFWCATFNFHSWKYLSGVFGNAHGWQHVTTIEPFSELDLHELIMKHHGSADYQIAYDRFMTATQRTDTFGGIAEIESQFFRLLWDRSNGNPRAGLVLWLSALRIEADGRLHVSIPQFRLSKGIVTPNDDHLFVYAAIMKHENATEDEIVEVTMLTQLAVRAVLRQAEESRIFYCDDDKRYRVTPLAQFAVTQMLIGRNFLYE